MNVCGDGGMITTNDEKIAVRLLNLGTAGERASMFMTSLAIHLV